jgi:hypothetical protein
MDAAEERWPLARGNVQMREPLRLLLRRTEGEDLRLLVERIEELEERVAATAPPPLGHVLFVALADGYEILESEDDPPPLGQLLLLFDGYYRVSGIRPSPFPDDRRPCLTIEAS